MQARDLACIMHLIYSFTGMNPSMTTNVLSYNCDNGVDSHS